MKKKKYIHSYSLFSYTKHGQIVYNCHFLFNLPKCALMSCLIRENRK